MSRCLSPSVLKRRICKRQQHLEQRLKMLPCSFQLTLLFCFFLSATAQFNFTTGCQNPQSPENCVCTTHPWSGPEIDMTCTGLEDVGKVLTTLKYNPYVVRLHLVNCHLPYLPLGLLPHRLTELYIVNSSMQYLSPPMSDLSAFDGLTNLTSLTIKGVTDLSNWDWSKLKPLANLQSIHIEDSYLPELPSSFSTLGDKYLWKLNITNGQILNIQPSALASKSLQSFASRGNPLRTLRVNTHNSNRALTNLELIGTKIPTVDPSYFTSLPGLRSLVIDSQLLSYMSSSPFSNAIHFLAIVGSPPACHCRYKYLLTNGLSWKEQCVLKASSSTTEYTLAEFLSIAC